MAAIATEIIRDARERAGLRQEDLAERVGVHRNTIVAMEAGRHVPRSATLAQVATVLGVSLEELFEHEPSDATTPVNGALKSQDPGRSPSKKIASGA